MTDRTVLSIMGRYMLDPYGFFRRNGKWIIRNKLCSKIAEEEMVVFSPPSVLSQTAVWVSVQSSKDNQMDGAWSTGEIGDYQGSYPWAVIENRAKDRCLLKALGVYGDIRSESEATIFMFDGKSYMEEKETLDRIKYCLKMVDAGEDVDAQFRLNAAQIKMNDPEKYKEISSRYKGKK